MQQIFHTAGGNFSAPNFNLTPRDLAGPASGSGTGLGQGSALPKGRCLIDCISKEKNFCRPFPTAAVAAGCQQQEQAAAAGAKLGTLFLPCSV